MNKDLSIVFTLDAAKMALSGQPTVICGDPSANGKKSVYVSNVQQAIDFYTSSVCKKTTPKLLTKFILTLDESEMTPKEQSTTILGDPSATKYKPKLSLGTKIRFKKEEIAQRFLRYMSGKERLDDKK